MSQSDDEDDFDGVDEIESVALYVRFDTSLVTEDFLAEHLLELEGVEDVDVHMV